MDPTPGGHRKVFRKYILDFQNFSLLRALDTTKSTVSIVCYRRMGHGMGQGVTHTLTHTVLGAKSKKNHRFLIENGGFLWSLQQVDTILQLNTMQHLSVQCSIF